MAVEPQGQTGPLGSLEPPLLPMGGSVAGTLAKGGSPSQGPGPLSEPLSSAGEWSPPRPDLAGGLATQGHLRDKAAAPALLPPGGSGRGGCGMGGRRPAFQCL